MDTKFSSELEKIEKLLNKVDVDLNTDFTKVDFSTFFKNVDKTFEIYNICLEELCGQLYLLEFPMHSKVVRKLYHHYKHQLYNIMKFQLNLQRELNERADEEKNLKIKMELLTAKLSKTTEKKRRLKQSVEEMRGQIDSLNQVLAANIKKDPIEMPKDRMELDVPSQTSMPNIAEASSKPQPEKKEAQVSSKKIVESKKSLKVISKEDLSDPDRFDLTEVNRLLEEKDDTETTVASRELVIKLLKDLDRYRREVNELKGIKMEPDKKAFVKPVDPTMIGSKQFLMPNEPVKKTLKVEHGLNTSGEFTTMEEFQQIVAELDRVCFELDRAKSAAEEGQQGWDQKVADYEKRIAEMAEEMERNKETLTYIDNISKDSNKRVTDLEEQLASQTKLATGLKEENQMLTKIIDKCEGRIAELEDLNANLKKEVAQFESEMPQYDSNVERMRTLSQENLELVKKIDRLEEVGGRGPAEMEENMQKLLEMKNKKIEKLEAEIQKWLKKNKITTKNASEVDEKLKMTMKNLADATNKNAELQKGNQGLKTLLGKLMKRLEGLDPKTFQMVKAFLAEAGGSSEIADGGPGPAGFDWKKLKLESISAAGETETGRDKNKLGKKGPVDPNETGQGVFKKQSSITRNEGDGQGSSDRLQGSSKEEYTDSARQGASADVEDYIHTYLSNNNVDDLPISTPKYDCSCQTDYFSVIDFIIDKEEEIRYNEVDLERIKEAADILADMIGFMGIQDYVDIVNAHQEPGEEEGSAEKENRRGAKKREKSVGKEKEPPKLKKPKVMKPNKIMIKKQPNARHIETGGEDKPDLNFPQFEQRDFSARPRPQKKNNLVRVKIERNEPEEMDSEDDYVVQKSKLIRNQNKKNETYEVVEFIRVPKQLNIARKDLPQPPDDGLNDADHVDMKRITGMPNVSFQQTTVEREKLFFRVYLNLKHRYQTRPEKFLSIYKLTFNKVPPFEARLNETYDPKTFLFNFAEFKEYFAAMINSHQICGPDCPHFGRFYRKTGIVEERGAGAETSSNAYVQELPKLLEEKA